MVIPGWHVFTRRSRAPGMFFAEKNMPTQRCAS
jgi:hypothetical protein